MSELAAALRAARDAAGVSLAAMARRTNYSKALLGHLETGKRTILPEHIQAYEDALGVPLGTDPIRRAHQWLVNPSPVAVQTRSGRRVGECPWPTQWKPVWSN
jgi:transcriptional regulator with XRE-family HTH domain